MAHYEDQRETDLALKKDWEPLKPKGSDQLFEAPQGETVVGICNFKGTVMIATSKKVYKLVSDVLIPIQFQRVNDFTFDHKAGFTKLDGVD